MSILRDFDEKKTVKCRFCGAEIIVEGEKLNKNCPNCGGTMDLNTVRADEWEKLKAFYEKNKE